MQSVLRALLKSPKVPKDCPCWTLWSVRDPYPVPDADILRTRTVQVGRFAASAREGASAEARFAAAAKKHLPKDRYPLVVKSTCREDMRDHVDCYVSLLRDLDDDDSLARYVCAVDVKAPKRARRGDARASSDIMWVETKNILGSPGWVHGKADVIAQEIVGEGFVLLDREALATFAETQKLRNPECVHVRPDRCREEVLEMSMLDCVSRAGVGFWKL